MEKRSTAQRIAIHKRAAEGVEVLSAPADLAKILCSKPVFDTRARAAPPASPRRLCRCGSSTPREPPDSGIAKVSYPVECTQLVYLALARALLGAYVQYSAASPILPPQALICAMSRALHHTPSGMGRHSIGQRALRRDFFPPQTAFFQINQIKWSPLRAKFPLLCACDGYVWRHRNAREAIPMYCQISQGSVPHEFALSWRFLQLCASRSKSFLFAKVASRSRTETHKKKLSGDWSGKRLP